MNVAALASSLAAPARLPATAPAARGPATPADEAAEASAQRRKVAGQFEAILVRQLLSRSVGSMLGGENVAGSVYGDLMTDALAQNLTAGPGLGLGRMIPFVLANAAWIAPEHKSRFKILRADIASLTDYDGHLANKVQFLLEATIGFIGIEQSNIIRVLTVVSVVGVPPTFFASMWGMNYRNMPELDWAFGYPMALMTIVLSAVLPIVWFRVRGWL